MPWKRVDPMEQRHEFIAVYLTKQMTFTALCLRFGVSRRIGYKWLDRYHEHGFVGLRERSRASLDHPNRVEPDVHQAIVTMRRKHKSWGPRKIRASLAKKFRRMKLPAPSTIGEIIRREGLAKRRRRRVRNARFVSPLQPYSAPNAIWCADFKGHFAVGGTRCHPLTISDGYSRFIIMCRALKRPIHACVKRGFKDAFRQYGLPKTIRTDNGPPFSTLGAGGLSRLSVWWMQLGIRHERIAPGRPDQNGRHERMHATLKAETAKPPRRSMSAQQRAFDAFRTEFNEERPHEALGYRTPSEFYRPSSRKFYGYLRDPTYPATMFKVRTHPHGVLWFANAHWYLAHCLSKQLVALRALGSDKWEVYFGEVLLGHLDLAGVTGRSVNALTRPVVYRRRYKRR